MLFQDYWNLCQSVWAPDETDSYWQEAVRRIEAFCEKYGTEFAKDLALALLNDRGRMKKSVYEVLQVFSHFVLCRKIRGGYRECFTWHQLYEGRVIGLEELGRRVKHV